MKVRFTGAGGQLGQALIARWTRAGTSRQQLT